MLINIVYSPYYMLFLFSCMGFSMDNIGNKDKALEYYDRALDIRLECLGSDHICVAETLHNKVRHSMMSRSSGSFVLVNLTDFSLLFRYRAHCCAKQIDQTKL